MSMKGQSHVCVWLPVQLEHGYPSASILYRWFTLQTPTG
jgi:hypothetical protein